MDMAGSTPFDGVDVGMFIEAHRDTHAWFVSLKHFPITLLENKNWRGVGAIRR